MGLGAASFAVKSSTVRASAGRFHRLQLAHERMSPAALSALQDALARDIATTAMRKSPYYRSTYGALRIDPGGSRTRRRGPRSRSSTAPP